MVRLHRRRKPSHHRLLRKGRDRRLHGQAQRPNDHPRTSHGALQLSTSERHPLMGNTDTACLASALAANLCQHRASRARRGMPHLNSIPDRSRRNTTRTIPMLLASAHHKIATRLRSTPDSSFPERRRRVRPPARQSVWQSQSAVMKSAYRSSLLAVKVTMAVPWPTSRGSSKSEVTANPRSQFRRHRPSLVVFLPLRPRALPLCRLAITISPQNMEKLDGFWDPALAALSS